MPNQNNNPDQVYTTYIRTSPEKLWGAITNPEFTRQYWFGHSNMSDFRKGSKWEHVDTQNKFVRIAGKVLESNPPKHLALSWADPEKPKNESRVSFDIEQVEQDMVKLTVVHGGLKDDSVMAGAVGKGWPLVIASLKSFLETGKGFTTKPGGPCAKPDAA